jgi:prepilin-type N-terminal cleavage/methylation domain-containing protein
MNGLTPRQEACRQERGFTLVETLIAMMILTIALLGIAAAVGLQSGGIAASLPWGQAAVSRGEFVSTATFLAQERLEQLKRLTYSLTAGDAFGADPIPAGFPDENPVAGFPSFSRQVRVTTGVPAANIKTVTVTVTFTLPKETGLGTESVAISTLIAARP